MAARYNPGGNTKLTWSDPLGCQEDGAAGYWDKVNLHWCSQPAIGVWCGYKTKNPKGCWLCEKCRVRLQVEKGLIW